jgi:hypothetical protein
VLARKPGALRNGAPFKDWVLPAAIERIRRRLASTDDGKRIFSQLLRKAPMPHQRVTSNFPTDRTDAERSKS